MCIGMANGGKTPKYLTNGTRVDDLGRITIPNDMLKRLGIVDGDVLQLTATKNFVIIEKCEGDTE